METILFGVSGAVWLVLETSLFVRDMVRGMGGTARDRGTRSLTLVLVLAAIAAADALASVAGPHSPLRIPGHPWIGLAGLIVVWAGLATRIWAVAELGHSFRTTVEVEAGQAVVSSGPYRLIRHPSYTGMLLISAGFGLGFHSWPGLALCVMLPLVSALRRIRVEEAELTSVLGEPYRAYSEHTKRLIPGMW
jgi:protein-S-isoprenylcysteine O-methyltransferase Ste14